MWSLTKAKIVSLGSEAMKRTVYLLKVYKARLNKESHNSTEIWVYVQETRPNLNRDRTIAILKLTVMNGSFQCSKNALKMFCYWIYENWKCKIIEGLAHIVLKTDHITAEKRVCIDYYGAEVVASYTRSSNEGFANRRVWDMRF